MGWDTECPQCDRAPCVCGDAGRRPDVAREAVNLLRQRPRHVHLADAEWDRRVRALLDRLDRRTP